MNIYAERSFLLEQVTYVSEFEKRGNFMHNMNFQYAQ